MKNFFPLCFLSTITSIYAGRGQAPPKIHIEGDPPYFEWATKSDSFVDKTALLRMFNRQARILITCPTNFGKSTNLDMIRRFFEINMNPNTGTRVDKKRSVNYKLFTEKSLNLEIAQHTNFMEEHFGDNSMLYIDFGNVRGSTSEEIISSMNGIIKKIFETYRWLFKIMELRSIKNKNDIFPTDIRSYTQVMDGDPDQGETILGLEAMMKFLDKHIHRPLFVIIDDYDTPIIRAIRKGAETKAIEEYVNLIIETFLKNKYPLRVLIIAGVSRVLNKGETLSSINHYYFLEDSDGVGKYFGFTDKEVDQLLTTKKLENGEREKVKTYYNGYNFKKKNTDQTNTTLSLYEPRGIRSFLESDIFDDDDSVRDSIIPQIMKCLKHDNVFSAISSLLSNKPSHRTSDFHMGKGDVKNFADMLQNNCSSCDADGLYLTYLQDNGYLSYTDQSGYSEIPNKVKRNKLLREFQRYYLETYGIDMVNSSLAASLSAILNAETTTDDMLIALANSLNQLLEPVRNTTLDEFQFQSIILATIIGKLNETKDVKLKDFETAKEEYITGYHTLRFISDDQKILLITRIAFQEGLDDALELAHQYAPLEPQSKSKFTLVKYVAINLNEKNHAEVAKAESRSEW